MRSREGNDDMGTDRKHFLGIWPFLSICFWIAQTVAAAPLVPSNAEDFRAVIENAQEIPDDRHALQYLEEQARYFHEQGSMQDARRVAEWILDEYDPHSAVAHSIVKHPKQGTQGDSEASTEWNSGK